jgi:hypothetical protein
MEDAVLLAYEQLIVISLKTLCDWPFVFYIDNEQTIHILLFYFILFLLVCRYF